MKRNNPFSRFKVTMKAEHCKVLDMIFPDRRALTLFRNDLCHIECLDLKYDPINKLLYISIPTNETVQATIDKL